MGMRFTSDLIILKNNLLGTASVLETVTVTYTQIVVSPVADACLWKRLSKILVAIL